MEEAQHNTTANPLGIEEQIQERTLNFGKMSRKQKTQPELKLPDYRTKAPGSPGNESERSAAQDEQKGILEPWRSQSAEAFAAAAYKLSTRKSTITRLRN